MPLPIIEDCPYGALRFKEGPYPLPHNLMIVNPGIEVYLLDPEGGILAFSAPPGKVQGNRHLSQWRGTPVR